jgi:hypothetical protein
MPMKLRRYSKIQEELLDQSIVDGFVAVPEYTMINMDPEGSCAYTKLKQKEYGHVESTFFPH